MWMTCFFSILWGAGVSICFGLVGAFIIYCLDPAQVGPFLVSFVVDFNAVLVGATTFGLLRFVRVRGGPTILQMASG